MPFILISSFAVLNLFIAIIVNAMHEAADEEEAEEKAKQKADSEKALQSLHEEISRLRADIGDLKASTIRSTE